MKYILALIACLVASAALAQSGTRAVSVIAGSSAAAGTTAQFSGATAGPGTISVSAGGTAVTGAGTTFLSSLKNGDPITSNGETHTVATITSDTALTTDAWTAAVAALPYTLGGATALSVFQNGEVLVDPVTPPNGSGAPVFLRVTPILAEIATQGITAALSQPAFGNTLSSYNNTLTGISSSPRMAAANTQNWTVASGGLKAIVGLPSINSGATGILTEMISGSFGLSNGSSGATITRGFGVLVPATANSGTITAQAAVGVDALTQATSNTYMLLGTTTIPTGNFGIYNTSANENYLAGPLVVGTSATATVAPGEMDLSKITATGTAPGAANLKIEAVAGTNAGSCKLIAYAGTSTTPVTIVDNVGSGC